jgi:hypothetical protein
MHSSAQLRTTPPRTEGKPFVVPAVRRAGVVFGIYAARRCALGDADHHRSPPVPDLIVVPHATACAGVLRKVMDLLRQAAPVVSRSRWTKPLDVSDDHSGRRTEGQGCRPPSDRVSTSQFVGSPPTGWSPDCHQSASRMAWWCLREEAFLAPLQCAIWDRTRNRCGWRR